MTVWEKTEMFHEELIGRQTQNSMLHSLKFSLSCELSKKQPHCLFPMGRFGLWRALYFFTGCWPQPCFLVLWLCTLLWCSQQEGRCPCRGLARIRRATVRQRSKQTLSLETHCLSKDEKGLLPGVSWELSSSQSSRIIRRCLGDNVLSNLAPFPEQNNSVLDSLEQEALPACSYQ